MFLVKREKPETTNSAGGGPMATGNFRFTDDIRCPPKARQSVWRDIRYWALYKGLKVFLDNGYIYSYYL